MDLPYKTNKKTAPVMEGDATRAVCKENSFCAFIGNIHKQVNYSQEILPPGRQLNITLQEGKYYISLLKTPFLD